MDLELTFLFSPKPAFAGTAASHLQHCAPRSLSLAFRAESKLLTRNGHYLLMLASQRPPHCPLPSASSFSFRPASSQAQGAGNVPELQHLSQFHRGLRGQHLSVFAPWLPAVETLCKCSCAHTHTHAANPYARADVL